MKRVEMCMVETEDNEGNDRNERCHQQKQRELAHESNPKNINQRYQPQKQYRDHPVLQSGMQRDPGVEIIRHRHTVRGAHEERPGPIPPSALKAPEVPEGGATPAVKA